MNSWVSRRSISNSVSSFRGLDWSSLLEGVGVSVGLGRRAPGVDTHWILASEDISAVIGLQVFFF